MSDVLPTLIVDDEPLARQRLALMLADHADVRVIGEAATAADAARLVRERGPALVFLDVSMPGGNGFRLLDALPPHGPRPHVVFVTAHPEHAVRAFDVDAVDYLLKPYDDERLAESLARVRRARAADGTAALHAELRAIAAALAAGGAAGSAAPARTAAVPDGTVPHPERFAVTLGRRTLFVAAAELDWVEAERNYVWLHANGQRHLHRCGIGQMEAQLDPRAFARVHRSAIVRLDRVRELRTPPGGETVAVLRDGTAVPVSQRYRARLAGP